MTCLSAWSSGRETSWSWKAWTEFKTAIVWKSRLKETRPLHLPAAAVDRVAAGDNDHKHLRTVYTPPGCDISFDGGNSARRFCRAYAIAGFGIAGSGLSDDPGRDVLSGCESGCHVVLGHRAARAPVRPGSGPEADDLDQFFRLLDHHAAVRS